MLMQHSVRTGQSYKGSCKLTVFAVFIREFCCIKWSADFHKLLSVIAPLEPGLSPLNIQPQIDRHILYRNTSIQKFCLGSIFQMDDGKCTLSQCLAVIFTKVDVVHVVIIHDQSGAVLMGFRLEFHFGCHPCIDAGQLSCQNTYFVQRGSGFLSTNSHITRSSLHICKSLRHDSRRIVPVAKLFSIEIIE